MKDYVYAHTQTRQDYIKDKKITSKQWQVYYYLLSQSYHNNQSNEKHRFIYKNSLNVSSAAKFLGISRPTIYTAIKNLKETGLLRETEEAYLIYYRNWTKIDNDTLKYLLSYSKNEAKGIDLLRTYLILKKINEVAHNKNDMRFTKKDLITFLGHNVTTTSDYDNIRNYLAVLTYFNLIKLSHHTEYKEGLGSYVIYHIQEINTTISNPEEFVNTIGDRTISEIPEYIKETLIGI